MTGILVADRPLPYACSFCGPVPEGVVPGLCSAHALGMLVAYKQRRDRLMGELLEAEYREDGRNWE